MSKKYLKDEEFQWNEDPDLDDDADEFDDSFDDVDDRPKKKKKSVKKDVASKNTTKKTVNVASKGTVKMKETATARLVLAVAVWHILWKISEYGRTASEVSPLKCVC